jgi:hypothetical protein
MPRRTTYQLNDNLDGASEVRCCAADNSSSTINIQVSFKSLSQKGRINNNHRVYSTLRSLTLLRRGVSVFVTAAHCADSSSYSKIYMCIILGFKNQICLFTYPERPTRQTAGGVRCSCWGQSECWQRIISRQHKCLFQPDRAL